VKNTILIDYPNKLNIIFDKLDFFHIKPILIGGYVRDKFLNLDSKDIDIELYGINSLQKLQNILQEFGTVNNVGKSFGVCKLDYEGLELDFSLPREDSKVSSGHCGFEIVTNSSLDFKTATSRRDFTINAIGYDVIEKKILDPFNGLHDLKNNILRAVNLQTFGEDPLRVLRAVQFSSRLNFTLEDNLISLCQQLVRKGTLKELARERIYEEFQKLLLKSKKPSIGFFLLKKLETFEFFKELSSLNDTCFTSMVNALDSYNKTKIPKIDITLMLTLICIDMTQNNSFSFVSKLTNDKEILQSIDTYKSIFEAIELKEFSNYEVYQLALHVNIEYFVLLLKAKYNNRKLVIDKLLAQAEDLGVKNSKKEALIQGRDLIKLGLKPSKIFSKILDNVYDAQLHNQFSTYDEAVGWLKNNLL